MPVPVIPLFDSKRDYICRGNNKERQHVSESKTTLPPVPDFSLFIPATISVTCRPISRPLDPTDFAQA